MTEDVTFRSVLIAAIQSQAEGRQATLVLLDGSQLGLSALVTVGKDYVSVERDGEVTEIVPFAAVRCVRTRPAPRIAKDSEWERVLGLEEDEKRL